MKMFDSEKIALINNMLEDFWMCSNVTEDSAVCLLNAIATVINFGKEKKNED